MNKKETPNKRTEKYSCDCVRKETHGDVIYRADAIDTLNKLDVSDGVGISSIACGVQESAIIAIQHLPSAQPDRSLWFRIGEICVDESKGFISAGRAVEKIRELLREAERREE